jgi:phage terminase large subunit-like protein
MICSAGNIDESKYYFDAVAAERPIRFFEQILIHVQGEKAGHPFVLEEWQKFHIRNVFGWLNRETGDRKHRYFYLEIPKGNGKSAFISGLALYMNAVDGPKGAETYCVAGDTNQARIVFDACKNMILENPRIKDKFICLQYSITHKKSGGIIKVLSSDTAGKHGFRPYFIAFDEMHVQPNRELYDVLTKGMMKSRNSLCGMITTAGEIGTFAEEMHDTAVSIANGLIENEYWYVSIYSAYNERGEPPLDDRLFDEDVIALANPGYGTIIRPADFDIIVQDSKAQKTGMASYKQLHLNVWVGSLNAYINVIDYRKCNYGEVDLDYHAKNNTVCFGGLDLASTEDLSAFALLFLPDDAMPELYVWHWCPEDTIIGRSKNQNVNYMRWVEDGFIMTTPGNVQDKDRIQSFIADACEKYNVQEIFADPSFHRAVLGSWIDANDLPIVPFTQTANNFTEPTKQLKIWSMTQGINVGDNPLLEWQIDNTMVYEDGNGKVRPMKTISRGKGRGSGREKRKIDGVVASIMAIAAYMNAEAEKPKASEIMIW